jgi:hypothetical protein
MDRDDGGRGDEEQLPSNRSEDVSAASQEVFRSSQSEAQPAGVEPTMTTGETQAQLLQALLQPQPGQHTQTLPLSIGATNFPSFEPSNSLYGFGSPPQQFGPLAPTHTGPWSSAPIGVSSFFGPASAALPPTMGTAQQPLISQHHPSLPFDIGNASLVPELQRQQQQPQQYMDPNTLNLLFGARGQLPTTSFGPQQDLSMFPQATTTPTSFVAPHQVPMASSTYPQLPYASMNTSYLPPFLSSNVPQSLGDTSALGYASLAAHAPASMQDSAVDDTRHSFASDPSSYPPDTAATTTAAASSSTQQRTKGGSGAHRATGQKTHGKKAKSDKPPRPLSAYNFFFKEQRQKLLEGLPSKEELGAEATSARRRNKNPARGKPHGKISFESLAKTIGEQWETVKKDANQKRYYQDLADQDKLRYNAQLDVWKRKQSEALTEQQKRLEESVGKQVKDQYLESGGAAAGSTMKPPPPNR